MLPTYVRLLHAGLLVPNQTADTVLDAGALLVIDARRGYGQRMAADAVRRAIGRAKELGACVLAFRNSAHIGRIGTYAELAACGGLRVHRLRQRRRPPRHSGDVAGGRTAPGHQPVLRRGPGTGRPGMMLDMATTTIAAGKARVAYNKGVPVPDGCLIDDAGSDQRSRRLHPRPHRRVRSFGTHKGSGPGGDVRDHGLGGRRRPGRVP